MLKNITIIVLLILLFIQPLYARLYKQIPKKLDPDHSYYIWVKSFHSVALEFTEQREKINEIIDYLKEIQSQDVGVEKYDLSFYR